MDVGESRVVTSGSTEEVITIVIKIRLIHLMTVILPWAHALVVGWTGGVSVCGGWARVWMEVVRPCPPVRFHVGTPRQLFFPLFFG